MPRPLLIIDSGSGGFTILKSILTKIPDLSFTYTADYGGYPYGGLSAMEIVSRVKQLVSISQNQRDHGMIVVACNTASTHTLPALREEYDIPIVGVVPAIKPACERYPGGEILLLATPSTVGGAYIDNLVQIYASGVGVHRFGSVDLVRVAEDSLHTGESIELVREAVGGIANLRYDAIVLGCTHFPLIATSLKKIFNGADVIDSASGIAERVQMLGADSLCQGACKRFFVTGDSPPPYNFLRQFGLSKPQILQMPFLAV